MIFLVHYNLIKNRQNQTDIKKSGLFPHSPTTQTDIANLKKKKKCLMRKTISEALRYWMAAADIKEELHK